MELESYKFYTLYLAEGCPYCDSALDLARDSGLEYYAHLLEWQDPRLLEAKAKYDHRTVPVIVETTVDGDSRTEKFIGGYTEFKAHLEE